MILPILAAVAILLVIGIVVTPYSRHVVRHTRMQGPAPMGGGPGGSGVGWLVSAVSTIGETKREEQYHYLRDDMSRPGTAEAELTLPQVAPPDTYPDGGLQLPRDEQSLTDDRLTWWSGRQWVSVNDYVPPSAPRSVDGEQWWDGEQWQWMPNTFESPSAWMPHSSIEGRIQKPQAQQSWIIEQRRHLADRWMPPPPPPPPDRSDPPPDWLSER